MNPRACAGLLTARPLLAHPWARACASSGLQVGPAALDTHGVIEGARGRGRLLVTLLDAPVVSNGAIEQLRTAGSMSVLLVPGQNDQRYRSVIGDLPDAVISQDDSTDILEVALFHVLRGGSFISAAASRLVLLELHRGDRTKGRDRRMELSEREREVLRLMVDGFATKVIARRLELAIKTVEAHRARIFSKLKVRNQREAVVAALSEPQILRSSGSGREK